MKRVAWLLSLAGVLAALTTLRSCTVELTSFTVKITPAYKAIEARVDSLERVTLTQAWHEKLHLKAAPPGGHGQ